MPCERRTRHRFQASFRWMDHCIFWRLGFRQSSFHQYHAGPSVHRSIRLDTITDLLPGCCSLCLSTPGKASDPRIFLRILPGCAGDTTRRFVAHHALVPIGLSPPGKSGDPRTSLRVPPGCAGDTAKRHTAHTGHEVLPHPAFPWAVDRPHSPTPLGLATGPSDSRGSSTARFRLGRCGRTPS